MKTVIVALALVLLNSSAQAQTVTRYLAWHQNDSVAEVLADRFTLMVNDATNVKDITPICAVSVLGDGITPFVPGTTCKVPIPPEARTLVITRYNGFSSASAMLSGTLPDQPLKLTITVTVSFP